MPRYRMPAWVYVDADSVPHAVVLFGEAVAYQAVCEGYEIERETGMVVYLDATFEEDNLAGGRIEDSQYCVDECEEE